MTTSSANADIRLERVSRTFGKVAAVNDISLSVNKGELCCLVGPSGCGKSTTLRMIAGLEIPDSGSISIKGKDVTLSPARSRGVGMVFQSYALFPHMSIFDNVAYGLKSRKTPKAEIAPKVHAALARVRLDGYGKRRPHELSGGEQQRAALARCLVTNPAVLLLDEPFSNLDAGLRLAMRQELSGLQKELGITSVFVTHDQEEAMTLADKIVLMNKGEIVQSGPPRELYEHPKSLFAASFMGKINLLKPRDDGSGPSVLGISLELENRPDSEGLAGVRPEHVRIAENKQGEPALVEEATFTGPSVRYIFRLEKTDEEIVAEKPAGETVFEKGNRIYLKAERDYILVF